MTSIEGKQVFEPHDIGLPTGDNISIDALIDDWEGFRILVRNHLTNGVTRIAFDTHVAYQYRDESDFIGEAAQSEGYAPNGVHSCFYRIKNSAFIARYLANSIRGLRSDSLAHFAIVTSNDCIDVIAASEPRVENLKSVAKQLADKSVPIRRK